MTNKEAISQISEHFDINLIYAQKVFFLAGKEDFLKNSEDIIKQKAKPFVKWVGGKRQLLKQFRDGNFYPPEKFDAKKNAYFEPFVGGGAVFFDLLPEKAFLSDLNFELVTTYRVIRDNVEALIASLKKHKYNKEYFLQIRSKNPKELPDISAASRFIYLNRTGFNGMYRVNKAGIFNIPFGKYSNPLICDEVNLRKVSEALRGVQIEHEDYKAVLKKAKKGDFIYFDPPYYPLSKTASFTAYTNEGFLDKEQTELRDVFVELHKRGCFVMLSNSDAPFINKIYSGIKGVNIHKVQAGRAINSKASGRGKVSEVLITNY